MRFAQLPNHLVSHQVAAAQQEALLRQLQGARTSPTQQLLAHELAMLRMSSPAPYNQQQPSMDDLARLEASRMATRQGSPLVRTVPYGSVSKC